MVVLIKVKETVNYACMLIMIITYADRVSVEGGSDLHYTIAASESLISHASYSA